jgi:hypothetical protein
MFAIISDIIILSAEVRSIPLKPNTFALVPLHRLDGIRRNSKVGSQKEHQSELLVHERECRAVLVNIAACLQQRRSESLVRSAIDVP